MQRSFDDLGTPLCDVTFVVFDVETTGGSPSADAITEVGAVKLRGGACLGTFQTLVNPGMPIPPTITYLTGITESMVLPAPPISEVLPAFLEFVGDAVLVGHNVRFDLAFMGAALLRTGRPKLANRSVDTCGLARRLVRDEVPNCKLETLARQFRLSHRPTHRALDDALATGELLHCLLERVTALGVTGLDDLLALPTVAGHPQADKLRLTARLPRTPGVYLFRDRGGRVLYVGKATDLRRRVRSYFTGDDRRKIGSLLRELHSIDHIECKGELEAAVLEIRLIHQLLPRFNRHGTRWRQGAYLKLTLNERFPRLSVVRRAKDGDGCLYLGPLPSTAMARHVADAIEMASPIRRCTKRPGREPIDTVCTPAQLGVAACPCAGITGEEEYAAIVTQVVRGLTCEPDLLLEPLKRRMSLLSAARRFEEAADMRDRASALVRAISRQRRLDGLRGAGRLRLDIDGHGPAVLESGRLEGLEPPGTHVSRDGLPPVAWKTATGTEGLGPLPLDMADELSVVAGWLEQKAARVRVVECDNGWSSALPRLPAFDPPARRLS
ncbi:MAG TPA: DEDD exonuclease domain-containing protein [Acidimicrobiales bacterium]|nr:DEDD exonuclease domain-containing protein [Acidimicrobiales bacterium]